MDIADVMQEIADRLNTITGLRVFAYPVDPPPPPPAAIVAYPGTYTFDATYGRGMDRLELPVVVLVGKVVDRATRGNVARFVAGSGPASIKQVVESGTYSAFDSVRVTGVEFDAFAIGAVDFLAATHTLDIAGQGAP